MSSYTEYLPEGWHVTHLGNKASIKARLGWKGLKADEYVDEGFIFLATPNLKGYQIDFDNVNYISERRYLESPEIMLQCGDVLLVKDGSTLGIVNIVRYLPAPATVNSSIAVIRPKEDLDGLYLYFYIQGQRFQDTILKNKGGLGVPHLFQADLKDFLIPLPSLPEQQKIAKILDTVDTAIALTQTHITKLKQAKAGLLHDLLTRGISEHGELTDPTCNPKQFKDSPLGKIPKDWDILQVKDFARVIRGASPRPKEDPRFYGGSIPRLMVEDVTRDGKWVTPKVDSLTIAGARQSRPLKKGDFVVVCSGTVGIPSILAIDACIHDGFLGLINIDNSRVSKDYLYLWFSYIREKMESAATHGGVFTNLTTHIMKESFVALPKLKEQKQIALLSEFYNTRISSKKTYLEKLKLLKKGLMSDLLTGKVRVKI